MNLFHFVDWVILFFFGMGKKKSTPKPGPSPAKEKAAIRTVQKKTKATPPAKNSKKPDPKPNTPGKQKAAKQAIDDLFSQHKKKKDDTESTGGESSTKKSKSEKKTKATTPKQDDEAFFDTRGTAGPRKYVDGLPVYTVEELGIGKGGDTPDCPFDCDCCF